MSHQPYEPHETASADQHYAAVEEELDQLIDTYRQVSDGWERIRCLDRVATRLANPSHADGTQLAHIDHVCTLANMLTVAIDRLARQ